MHTRLALVVALAMLPAAPADADLVISQLIIDFKAKGSRAQDIEVLNRSEELSFVSVEPAEIIDPGTRSERRVASPDPARLGLLVSPTRFVLEPHQRRRLRIAAIGSVTARERVYRVTIKPVVGKLTGTESGLKVLVGYDLLVLVRPAAAKDNLKIERLGNAIMITNLGAASIELAQGKQCDSGGRLCHPLPGKRLYAGSSWQQPFQSGTTGEYQVRSINGWWKIKL